MKNLVLIGERLRFLRDQSDFTQNIIAKYLRVDQSFIAMVESGKRALSTDMLEKLSYLYGVDTLSFVSDEYSPKALKIALRAGELVEEDLNCIAEINRIALNCNFMLSLLGGQDAN